ncbi:metallophosphoesterase [Candidatus Thioglobus sp.]|nr:metallophosphoesterase [Candidatus Thioglobus sp.]MDB3893896.1 metallophosphoesterase [Candidatus Thioglobus sp.]MDC0904172.1 metallophosphoesterase [Candidatus Thioglobus sp.]MDC0920154.1 metallophosphoesterase [Candidatus Thioglobus sp.]MDC0965551.1 metallophosphoesterase [Candidatus Thioglobus sp.]
MPKLIQISDCHIDDQRLAMGVDSQKNLQSIIEYIQTVKSDALLISGDLTHHGTLNSYRILKKILSPIKRSIFVIKGNHDDAENLGQVFKDNLFKTFRLDNWEVISIDSVQTGKTSGLASEAALLELDDTCLNSNADHVMVVLHHPIVPMNSSWDDELSLENSQDLFKVLDKHSKIRSIVFGHAHEASEFFRLGKRIISCPSTALQFNQETRIGFNEFELHKNGTINLKTQWI